MVIINKEFDSMLYYFDSKVEAYKAEAYKAEDSKNDGPWIQTYSGIKFTPTNPDINSISLKDIAHALSLQCRFSGHIKTPYNVAQHSVLVSYICDFEDAMLGLFHDASEAYLVDLPTPLKRSGKFDYYIECEANLSKIIYQRFGIKNMESKSVDKADKMLLVTEAQQFMAPLHKEWVNIEKPIPFEIIPWSPAEAEQKFIDRYMQLRVEND
jgi:5'-deoxynucleotidase YfbR-like HD superfamily hydrolase